MTPEWVSLWVRYLQREIYREIMRDPATLTGFLSAITAAAQGVELSRTKTKGEIR